MGFLVTLWLLDDGKPYELPPHAGPAPPLPGLAAPKDAGGLQLALYSLQLPSYLLRWILIPPSDNYWDRSRRIFTCLFTRVGLGCGCQEPIAGGALALQLLEPGGTELRSDLWHQGPDLPQPGGLAASKRGITGATKVMSGWAVATLFTALALSIVLFLSSDQEGELPKLYPLLLGCHPSRCMPVEDHLAGQSLLRGLQNCL